MIVSERTALENAYRAGKPEGVKNLTGGGKQIDKDLVISLVERGLLDQVKVGKGLKYQISHLGQESLRQEHPEIVQAIEEEMVQAAVRSVEQSGETKKPKVLEEHLAHAEQQDFVEKIKKDRWRVTRKGRGFLLSTLSPEDLSDHLEMVLDALGTKVKKEADGLGADHGNSGLTAHEELAREMETLARDTLGRIRQEADRITQAVKIPGLLGFIEELDIRCRVIGSKGTKRLETERKKIDDVGSRLNLIQGEIKDIRTFLRSGPPSPPENGGDNPPEPPPPPELPMTLADALLGLCRDRTAGGRVVRIPVLFDELRDRNPGITRDDFDRALKSLKSRLNFGRAGEEDQQGGIWFEQKHFYYVNGVR